MAITDMVRVCIGMVKPKQKLTHIPKRDLSPSPYPDYPPKTPTREPRFIARQRPEEGGNIKFLNVVLSDRAKADSAIKSKATK